VHGVIDRASHAAHARNRRLTKTANSALKGKAEKAHPDEYRRASKKYTFDEY
jgi:hypothetical protein